MIVRGLGQHSAGVQQEGLIAASLLQLGDQSLPFGGPLQGGQQLAHRRAHRLDQLDELGVGGAGLRAEQLHDPDHHAGVDDGEDDGGAHPTRAAGPSAKRVSAVTSEIHIG